MLKARFFNENVVTDLIIILVDDTNAKNRNLVHL